MGLRRRMSDSMRGVRAFALIGAVGCAAATACVPAPAPEVNTPDTPEWIPLFNGKDLDGWTARIPGQAAGEDVNEAFRVAAGVLTFGDRKGFLFYTQRPFSHYTIVVEYRFPLGDAGRAAAVIIHSEPPDSMRPDQQRPVGLELALKSYSAGEWARAEAIVLGDSLLKQVIKADTVVSADGPKPFTQGYIALEAKGARVDVRKLELLNLKGCMDPEALTYKRYFVKPDSTVCFYAQSRP